MPHDSVRVDFWKGQGQVEVEFIRYDRGQVSSLAMVIAVVGYSNNWVIFLSRSLPFNHDNEVPVTFRGNSGKIPSNFGHSREWDSSEGKGLERSGQRKGK